jgi:cellulose biosynthesis protein BcsQ
MLHALLISTDSAAADLLSRVLRQTGQITLDQVYSSAPTHYQLSRTLNTLPLDVAFVDMRNRGHAELVRAEIAKRANGTAIVGFSPESDDFFPGLAPYTLALPFSLANVQDTVQRAIRSCHQRPLNNIFALVSTKGGGGATSITLNVAAHLSTSFKKTVLVAEADLRFGTISDWINARPAESIAQTLASSDSCMSMIWPRHVCRKFGVDWMLTARDRSLPQPRWFDYHHLLRFVSQRYEHTLVDLPHLLDAASAEIVQLAQTVFVVTTAEVLSLRLARQRISELESIGVPKSRIRLLVNRLESRDLQPDDIERTIDCEVGGVFPNDYPAVSEAILEGEFLRANTRLGRSYRAFAEALAAGAFGGAQVITGARAAAAGAGAGGTRPALHLESTRSLFGAFMGSRRATAVMSSLLAQKQ